MAITETTYRVQGIPANTSPDDIKIIISKALSEDRIKPEPIIHSLGSDPYKPPNTSTKVATVTFAHIPEILNKRGELTADVSWDNKTYRISVDSSFRGFTPLNDTEDEFGDMIDIIAISGLSSHPFGSWKARGGTFMWLRDEVAKTANRARVLLYGYDTSLVNSESFQDIGDIATRLSSDVNAIRGGRPAQNVFVPTPIVFIAHSLGGLVVKEAIYKMSAQYPDDFLNIYGLLFFGVPNDGIKTEYWMPIVDRKPNRSLITSLEPDAYYLRNLQDNFNRVFCFPDARVTSVYETMKSATTKEELTGEWKLNGPSDILVSRNSAIGHYSHRVQHNHIAFNQNHSGLPKFISNYDENYRAVEPFFTKCYNDAFEVIQKRFVDEATRPEYNVNSTGGYRLMCQSCHQVYKSQVKLLQHLKGDGNDTCYLKVVRYAITNGRLSTASMLLATDKRIEAKNESTGTALLHDATQKGQLDVVRLLLNQGANIEVKNNIESTPLSYAAENGHMDVAELLLDRGANIEAKTNNGITPLARAAWEGKADVAKLLLDRGANIEAKTDNGFTPLAGAASNGKADVAKLLLDRGANIEAKNNNGATPLAGAAWEGKVDVAKLLLDRGANIEAKTNDGSTPLSYAAWNGKVDVAKLLLDRGANIEAKTDNGFTPLAGAAWNGKADVAVLLLDRGANIEAKTNDGSTPLSYASQNGKADIATLLLDRGANIEAKKDNGLTPLADAAWEGKADVAKLLLDRGANIEAKTNDGSTPLSCATRNGKTDVATLLLDRGANIEAKTNDGLTPLAVAAWNGKAGMATLLLDRGANMEAKENNGATPLSSAAWEGKADVAKLLLDRGANIEAKKDNGATPLADAAWNGKADVAVLLLDRGANIEAKSKDGSTPLSYASRNGKADVVKLLLDRGARKSKMRRQL